MRKRRSVLARRAFTSRDEAFSATSQHIPQGPHGRGRPTSPATAAPRFATPPPEEGEAGSEHATAPDAGATRSGLRSRFGLGRATALLESGDVVYYRPVPPAA